MITSDCHVHTEFSGDSSTPMEDQLERFISLGIKTVCFTDHYDYGFPEEELPDGSFVNVFLLDAPAYTEKARRMKEIYRDRIEVLTGVELGLSPAAVPVYTELLKNYSFDFVLGSVHMVDGKDPYFPPYWRDYEGRQGLVRYFETMLEQLALFDDFDSLAHLDYIIRYVCEPDGTPGIRSYELKEFKEFIDEALKFVIRKDKALEVNTAGYKYGLGVPNPCPETLARYRELGGERITIGSDGHKPEHVAFAFEQTEALLVSLGFRGYSIYRDRRPTFVPF